MDYYVTLSPGLEKSPKMRLNLLVEKLKRLEKIKEEYFLVVI